MTTPIVSTRIATESKPTTSHPSPSKRLSLFQSIENVAQRFEDEKTQRVQQEILQENKSPPPTPVKRPARISWSSSMKDYSTSPQPLKKSRKNQNDVEPAPVAGSVSLTPLAPKNTPPARALRQSPYEELFSKVQSSQSLSVQGLTTTLNHSASGTFMNAYSIKADMSLIPDVPNDQLLLKLYHGQLTKFSPKLTEYMQNSIANYKAVQKLAVPVATIYNLDTALEDHFFTWKKSPTPST